MIQDSPLRDFCIPSSTFVSFLLSSAASWLLCSPVSCCRAYVCVVICPSPLCFRLFCFVCLFFFFGRVTTWGLLADQRGSNHHRQSVSDTRVPRYQVFALFIYLLVCLSFSASYSVEAPPASSDSSHLAAWSSCLETGLPPGSNFVRGSKLVAQAHSTQVLLLQWLCWGNLPTTGVAILTFLKRSKAVLKIVGLWKNEKVQRQAKNPMWTQIPWLPLLISTHLLVRFINWLLFFETFSTMIEKRIRPVWHV